MKDRIDLENEMHQCNSVVYDLEMVYENILDNPKFPMPPETADRVANILLGLKELYEMRFDRLHDTFAQAFRLNQYHSKEFSEDCRGPDVVKKEGL